MAVPVGLVLPDVAVTGPTGTSVTEPGFPGTGISVRDAAADDWMTAVPEFFKPPAPEEVATPGIPAPGAVEPRPEALGFLVGTRLAVSCPGLVLVGTSAVPLTALTPGTA